MRRHSQIDFDSCNEAFGITPLPSARISFFEMESFILSPSTRMTHRSVNIQRRSVNSSIGTSKTTLRALMELTALPLTIFSAEADISLTNYDYLAQQQGTKHAIDLVHTSEEKVTFRELVFNQAHNQLNNFGRKSIPDCLNFC
ncbi:hypothetical protein [Parasitella parasitica]|uniref:Uncharacterized protein n=1 Tax=Parasitella parasitica TaxID=35722 RepID=A0A0B7NRW7_9FUNG|nr:hypothetical protein [Parasitella parasitica]